MPATDRPIHPQRFGSGQAVHRLEDEALLQGRGRYTDDLATPDDGWLVFVRSPHAHAAIGAIDCDAARALSGVRAIITGAELVAAGMPPLAVGAPFRRADGSACASIATNHAFITLHDSVNLLLIKSSCTNNSS